MDGRSLSLRLRGVRRGCPLLPCPFVPCVEVVAMSICGENEMKGISVGKVNRKLSQYSEDTTMMLIRRLTSVAREVFCFVRQFRPTVCPAS